MSHTAERLAQIRTALAALAAPDLPDGARDLLGLLGYRSPKTLETGGAPAALLEAVGVDPERFQPFGGVGLWRTLNVVFQLTGDELPALTRGSTPSTSGEYRGRDIDSFVFLTLDLHERAWTRRELVGITRELNRGFAMPAILLFRHLGHATLAVIDRRRNRRDETRDVVGGRISLVKDIDLAAPHRAHLDILADLTLSALRPAPTDFRGLYDGWLKVLSASELNKRFYNQLADWFAWASGEGVVQFPPGQGNADGERQIGLIRLLTRLMFVWFIKQKSLVPDALFDAAQLGELLEQPPHAHPDGHGYYVAVIHNLFFACLNTEMPRDVAGSRDWLRRDTAARSRDYGSVVLRNRAMFRDPDTAKALFDTIPFLNGGLFDSLDVHDLKSNDARASRAVKEGARLVLRVDGFSEEPERQPRLPNRLFFGGQPNADLSAYYGKRTFRDAPGLIDLFERYKFTVEENTPLEEEAALDPELLGKVFENLLASYNEDTKTTARNKSGSFYTPREVVDFMVDEALVAYLAPVLAPATEPGLRPRNAGLDFGPGPGELALERAAAGDAPSAAVNAAEHRLRALLSYARPTPAFSDAETDALVAAIERCRAIDPAVGSGAFPLGLLQKLVHVLARLDPDNAKWRARNREPLERAERIELDPATRTPDLNKRAERLAEAREKLAAFDASFDANAADYARKLYLIEGCLHGVDIQPIAVQIAKLRCFIALAVEQAVDDARPNRGVTPLPNLEMKFVAANALGLVASGQGQLRDPAIVTLEAERQEVNAAFFSARNRRAKQAARKRILEIREELGALLAASGFPAEDARALAAWDPFDANAAARFFDPEWMFGLGDHQGAGFDIVMANPPYVRGGAFKELKPQLASYDNDTGSADLYVYFYERSVRLLKPGGVIAFITSNKWYRAGYGAKLRAWLSAETRLRAVIDFGDAEVFEAIAYPTIVVAQKRTGRITAAPPTETFRALNWTPGEAPDGFPAKFAAEAFVMPQAALLGSGWQLEPQGKRDLLARLRAAGKPLGEWCGGRFYRGILTGLNEAFVIDGAKRAELVAADPASAEIIKPFLRGRDVKRWAVEPADQWLIKIPSSENADHPWKGKPDAEAERIFAAKHPVIYTWWMEENLRGPLIARADQGHYFWELRSCAYWAAFEEPKIVVAAIVARSESAPDFEGYFSNNKSTIYIPPSVGLAAAVVNSSVSDWFARQTFAAKQGGFLDFEPRYSGTIPIPTPIPEQEALITAAVDAILAGAQPRAPLESLLNAFVYELFFPEEVVASGSPFAAAREAGLPALSTLTGPALARAAEQWSRTLSDPQSPLYRSLFALQSLEPVRIIEGRS